MKVIYFTNKGKVRSNNEDSLLVVDTVISEGEFQSCEYKNIEKDNFVLVVADGMGGHAKGEVASRIVLESIKELNPFSSNEDIIKALENARNKLEEYVKVHPEAFGMGCAIAGIWINGNNGIAFNIGDCRVYKLINGKLIRLTRDHSVVEELLLDGIITPEEARVNPQRHILTSAIMGDGYTTQMKIFTTPVDISLGGRFLICSDGLWDELDEEEIKMCISSEEPCEKFLEILTQKPLRDNVSFIVLL